MKTLTVCLLLAFTWIANAKTYYVTDPIDNLNVVGLRKTIIEANAAGGTNVIVLVNSVYPLTIAGADEDAGLTGDLDITRGDLTITSASGNVTIDATGLGDRIFQVFTNAHLTLSHITLVGGTAPQAQDDSITFGAEYGGAIYNAGVVTLVDCIITNNSSGGGNYIEGNAGGSSAAGGGGIYNAGRLTMTNCLVTGNAAGSGFDGSFGGDGGGLYNCGMCNLSGCTIIGNQSGLGGPPAGNAWNSGGGGGNGGGIYNSGSLHLDHCMISTNWSGAGSDGWPGVNSTGGGDGVFIFAPIPGAEEPGGAGGGGGGIYNAGVLWLTDCTIGNNSTGWGGSGSSAGTGGSGGGLYNAGNLSLNTCTVSGNLCRFGGATYGSGNGVSGGGGGGIYNSGSLDLVACTIAFNASGSGGSGGLNSVFISSGGAGGNGGGILNDGTNAVGIANTLIALNLTGGGIFGGLGGTDGPNGSGTDGYGYFQSQGFNLVGQSDGLSGVTNGVNHDLAGSAANPLNPLLSPLQWNGGTNLTYALLPGSPAIDAGDDSLLGAPENLVTDQRGNPRKSGAHVDIGAFEYDGTLNGLVLPPVLPAPVVAGGAAQFHFNAAAGLPYSLWASTNLTTWTKLGLATESSRGWFLCQDTNAVNLIRRFYQIRQP